MNGAELFPECAVERPAILLNPEQRPFYSPTTGACVSATIRFVVDTTGTPETGAARTVRTNDFAFAQALLRNLERWRYQPAVRKGRRVRQIVTEGRTVSSLVYTVRVPAGRGMPSLPPTPPPSQPPC